MQLKVVPHCGHWRRRHAANCRITLYNDVCVNNWHHTVDVAEGMLKASPPTLVQSVQKINKWSDLPYQHAINCTPGLFTSLTTSTHSSCPSNPTQCRTPSPVYVLDVWVWEKSSIHLQPDQCPIMEKNQPNMDTMTLCGATHPWNWIHSSCNHPSPLPIYYSPYWARSAPLPKPSVAVEGELGYWLTTHFVFHVCFQ